ncbi:MAG: threonine synthase [Novosphingobium sp.]
MQYISTRGGAPALDFEGATLAGLASDGGLYVPSEWPHFSSEEIAAMASMPYAELAATIMAPFVGDSLTYDRLRELTTQAYGRFAHKAVTPLKQLDEQQWVLELFHGPTLAFKDVALQLLGLFFEEFLSRSDRNLTIVGATSGDTGSAAIDAVAGREKVDIFMLHPQGRVSDVQRRQMTTVLAPNVYNIAIEGSFDDAQAMVKRMFNDTDMTGRFAIGAVNSINWARLMAQVVYYFAAAVQLGAPHRPVAFSVPTGNFGDVFAGYVAAKMGLPVAKLMLFQSARADADDMASIIRWAWENCGELIDPHTACGLFAARAAGVDAATPVVTLATAHPAKFPEAVERSTGPRPSLPARVGDLFDREEKCVELPGTYEAVAEFVAGHATPRA